MKRNSQNPAHAVAPWKLVALLAWACAAGCAEPAQLEQPVSDGRDAGSTQAKTKSEDTAAASERMLIEPEALERQLGDANLRVLDTRPPAEYDEGHVPGAVRVDPAEWRSRALADGGLQDKAAWSETVGRLGIQGDSRVVVYGATGDAARIWWTLKYLGLESVSLLNGGWEVWTSEGRRVEKETPTVAETDFEPQFQADRLVQIGDLKEWLQDEGVAVVDARSQAEYTGQEARAARGGRIPGAVHLEWKDLLAEDGRFKPRAELRKMFEQRGVKPDQTVVTYCQSGGRASVDAFAAELAGYRNVRNYYCSWQQWGADEQAPIEQGP